MPPRKMRDTSIVPLCLRQASLVSGDFIAGRGGERKPGPTLDDNIHCSSRTSDPINQMVVTASSSSGVAPLRGCVRHETICR
jgi:hypothetical protein